jgi:hypothetical protein
VGYFHQHQPPSAVVFSSLIALWGIGYVESCVSVGGVPVLVLFAVVAGYARFSPFGGLWFDFLDFDFLICFRFC